MFLLCGLLHIFSRRILALPLFEKWLDHQELVESLPCHFSDLRTNCLIKILRLKNNLQGCLKHMVEEMDDGEVEILDHVPLGRDESSANFPSPTSAVDSIFDELLKNTTTCTHTHLCNPPGPYASVHMHTCYHTHKQVLASEDEGDLNSEQRPMKAKRPLGNREAVRKYREKKKAHAVYLEEEVQKLRVVNQQLVRKLQGQAILEAEVVRLRSVLVELRSKIDGELSSSPFQNPCYSAIVSRKGDCGMQSAGGGTMKLPCLGDLPCFLPLASSSDQDGVLGGGKALATLACEANCQPTMTVGPVDVMETPFLPPPSVR